MTNFTMICAGNQQMIHPNDKIEMVIVEGM